MTIRQICDKSPVLRPAKVEWITDESSWDNVSLEDMHAFVKACGIDFCDPKQMHRAFEYLKSKPTFIHLRTSPEWKRYWEPMIIRWRKSYGAVTKQSLIWPPLRDLLIRLTPVTKL